MIKEIPNSFEMIPSSPELSSLSTPTDDRTSQTARSVLQNDPGTPPLSALSHWDWNPNPPLLTGRLSAIEEIDLDNLPEEASEAPTPPPLLPLLPQFQPNQDPFKKPAQTDPSADAPSPLQQAKQKKKKREEEPSEGTKRQKPESDPESVSTSSAIATQSSKSKKTYISKTKQPDIQALTEQAVGKDNVQAFLRNPENKKLLRQHKTLSTTIQNKVSKSRPIKKKQSLDFQAQPPEVKALIERIHTSKISLNAYLQDPAHLEEIEKLKLKPSRLQNLMNRYKSSHPQTAPADQPSEFPSELPPPTKKRSGKYRSQSYHEQSKGLQKHIRHADRSGRIKNYFQTHPDIQDKFKTTEARFSGLVYHFKKHRPKDLPPISDDEPDPSSIP